MSAIDAPQDENQARPEASPESALQLRNAVYDLNEIEQRFLSCDSVGSLPFLARQYAEAYERANAAMAAVRAEAGIMEIQVLPRPVIGTRG